MNQPNDAVFIDQVGHSATAVTLSYFSIGIGHQRERDAVGSRKPLVFVQAVGADADDQHFAIRKFFQIPLEIIDLRRSDGRKDGKIERQYDVFTAEVVHRVDGPLG